MTREEAIIDLNALKFILNNDQYTDEIEEALDTAISSLQQPEIIRCRDCRHWRKQGLCGIWDHYISNGDFYCGCAEQREGEADG